VPRRPGAASAVLLAATLLAFAAVLDSAPDVWRQLDGQHSRYAPLSADEARRYPVAELGFPADTFDFYARYVVAGDRVYLDVPDEVAASFGLAARYWLLPATPTQNLADATVVVSYDHDPAALGIDFVTQRQDGRRPLFVSRIGAP
jgi:hypothetical protein